MTQRPKNPSGLAAAVSTRWQWAYATFRFSDGIAHAMIALAPVVLLGLPAWTAAAMAAAMNVAAVPGAIAWGALMEKTKGVGRRRLAVGGFSIAAFAIAGLAASPPLWLMFLLVAAFAGFGIATAPAASVLLLEGLQAEAWSKQTARYSRMTGTAYLVGVALAVIIASLDLVPMQGVFLLSAALSLAAAAIAWYTIEPAAAKGVRMPKVPPENHYQRRFERALWWPSRLRNRPALGGLKRADGHPLVLLWGYFLMFAGSTIFFAGYPGVMADSLGLSLGIVLLAQVPSNLVTPLAYGQVGDMGARHGELHGIGVGIALRLLTIPAMCLLLAFWTGAFLPVLLVVHGLVGVSFAFLQINGTTLLAKVHRGGRGQGVGAYHAAVGMGSVVGSLAAAAMLAAMPYQWTYVPVVLLLVAGAGCWAYVRRSSQFAPRNTA